MDPKNRLNLDEAQVNQRIEEVRSRRPRLTDEHITLAHGAGGKASAALVDSVFLEGYGNDVLAEMGDAGVIELPELAAGTRLAMSTDSYVVSPIQFPGGSIGELAVNGTVNDLAVSGAVPAAISAAFVIEEGLSVEVLRREVAAMRAAAEAAGVRIITGDTKVVPRGAADQLFITTAGVGVVPAGRQLGAAKVQRGDKILLSGAIADHGMAVMLARGDLAIDAPIQSDTRAVNHLTEALLAAAPNTRWMRDATRGGLGTVLNELAQATGLGVVVEDEAVGVHDMTRGACDMLGIDPLYVANEGTFVAVVAAEEAEAALAAVQGLPGGEEAALVGRIVIEPASSVVLVTGFGGTRMVDMLVGDPLPRIC
ncbi:hydrogenase expression/formation protein HypE [Propionicimonas sp.]|uniref:hydrogenase expression/formation protein HypE n=1 Tax=Propionicimonas sp. TaxID=1955623 RepID=UPI00185336F7|nr:hydrogenase expression/formation protein HypE [Propionicimonas sp.]MBU3975727.1 hydrogenase expression/formation protein HypE [Actinomycetota bacterium]MBA3019870.1 hydrogenase expression/formation protein HypE [Propionicimonas sp.]MBU3986124.1 hydrogenase expression/formation protein HypE [Actinomycetota bacterium]MBU4007443.1 hydrogenase expression/formation protein HypE [Actinomycetota bacterium]MBU4063951.1 hydrogenase expression/formation protein HypE [Actinomycetota bacterium]